MKTELNYQLTLSEEHMQILWEALELYTRIHMGQWEECSRYSQVPIDFVIDCDKALRKVAEEFEATPYPGSYYGIFSKKLPITASIAFDMEQVIRRHLSLDRHPEGGFGVHFDKPGHWVKDRPLPEVETIRQHKNHKEGQ
jgi:hypothetical protein